MSLDEKLEVSADIKNIINIDKKLENNVSNDIENVISINKKLEVKVLNDPKDTLYTIYYNKYHPSNYLWLANNIKKQYNLHHPHYKSNELIVLSINDIHNHILFPYDTIQHTNDLIYITLNVNISTKVNVNDYLWYLYATSTNWLYIKLFIDITTISFLKEEEEEEQEEKKEEDQSITNANDHHILDQIKNKIQFGISGNFNNWQIAKLLLKDQYNPEFYYIILKVPIEITLYFQFIYVKNDISYSFIVNHYQQMLSKSDESSMVNSYHVTYHNLSDQLHQFNFSDLLLSYQQQLTLLQQKK